MQYALLLRAKVLEVKVSGCFTQPLHSVGTTPPLGHSDSPQWPNKDCILALYNAAAGSKSKPSAASQKLSVSPHATCMVHFMHLSSQWHCNVLVLVPVNKTVSLLHSHFVGDSTHGWWQPS